MRQQPEFQREVTANTVQLELMKQRLAGLEQTADRARQHVLSKSQDTNGDRFTSSYLVGYGGRHVEADRGELGAAIQKALAASEQFWPRPNAYRTRDPLAVRALECVVGGVPFNVSMTPNPDQPGNPSFRFALDGLDEVAFNVSRVELGNADSAAFARRLEQRVTSVPTRVDDWELQRNDLETSIEKVSHILDSPWPKAAQLKELRDRREEIVKEMTAEAEAPDQQLGGQDTDQPKRASPRDSVFVSQAPTGVASVQLVRAPGI